MVVVVQIVVRLELVGSLVLEELLEQEIHLLLVLLKVNLVEIILVVEQALVVVEQALQDQTILLPMLDQEALV